MDTHLERYASETSRNSSEKDKRHDRRLYATSGWVNPCITVGHTFTPKDLEGAPKQTSKQSLEQKAYIVNQTQEKAKAILTEMINIFFQGTNKDDFATDTAHYHLKNLMQLPSPTKEYFAGKRPLETAMGEVYKCLMYYTVALRMTSCENLIFVNRISDMMLSLEKFHFVIVLDMEMTFLSLRKPVPADAKKEANVIGLVVLQSRLARIIRQYSIVRDYVEVMKHLEAMYQYFAGK